MAEQLSHYFLTYVHENLKKANEYLGRGPGVPGGGVDPDATDQEISNHAAIVELTESLEYFRAWAVELSDRLERAALVELVREAP